MNHKILTIDICDDIQHNITTIDKFTILIDRNGATISLVGEKISNITTMLHYKLLKLIIVNKIDQQTTLQQINTIQSIIESYHPNKIHNKSNISQIQNILTRYNK